MISVSFCNILYLACYLGGASLSCAAFSRSNIEVYSRIVGERLSDVRCTIEVCEKEHGAFFSHTHRELYPTDPTGITPSTILGSRVFCWELGWDKK